jgi:predicted DCC family thiol-disulfide oxidoreductase YuxK
MVKDKHIVLVDGYCNLCNGLVHFIKKRDRHEKFLIYSLQSETGLSLLAKAGLSTEKIDTVVFIRENEYFFKSAATLNIMKEMDGVWKLFYGLIIIPRFFRDAVYDVVAKSRYYVFGKRDYCEY